MSLVTVMQSVQSAAPVELYEFQKGNTYYRYNTSPRDIIYNSNTYLSSPIRRSKITQTENINKTGVDFILPKSNNFALYYVKRPAVQITYVTVTKMIEETSDTGIFWKGRIIGASLDGNLIKLTGEPVFTAQKRPGLRKVYESMCSNMLYDTNCRVDRSAYELFTSVVSVSGKTAVVNSVDGAADHYYTVGYLKTTDLERYHIAKQIGTTLTFFLYPEFVAGDSISIFPGCDHLYTTCVSKFSNGLNFSGFPFMPNRNPFVGSIL